MDNPSEWGPRPAAIAVIGLLGVLMAVACALIAHDAQGRILTGFAAAGLILFTAGSWRARPRLALRDGALVYHCLDLDQPISASLARDEALVAAVQGEGAERD